MKKEDNFFLEIKSIPPMKYAIIGLVKPLIIRDMWNINYANKMYQPQAKNVFVR